MLLSLETVAKPFYPFPTLYLLISLNVDPSLCHANLFFLFVISSVPTGRNKHAMSPSQHMSYLTRDGCYIRDNLLDCV